MLSMAKYANELLAQTARLQRGDDLVVCGCPTCGHNEVLRDSQLFFATCPQCFSDMQPVEDSGLEDVSE